MAGRTAAVKSFINFCSSVNVSYKRVNYSHVCWYVELLANRKYTPGTISNHISHLRTFYKMADLPVAPFHHYRVCLALRAVATTIRRAPIKKAPVTADILKTVVASLPEHQHTLQVKMAVILMFQGFLRQSSVAPTTVANCDPTRHLVNADLSLSPKGLHIRLKWTKTIQKSVDAKALLLPPTADHNLCPVKTHKQILASTASLQPQAPYLAFKDGNPITTRAISKMWVEALAQAGLSPSLYSLHSLRKGGASYA